MIVNIAGTSGAGKTTAARAVLAQATSVDPVKSDGKVVANLLELPGKKTTCLMGRYEEGLQTCGCDTIKDVARVYSLVEDFASMGYNVVFEGLFMMNHTRGPQTVWMAAREGWGFTVVRLTTPIEVCKQSVNERRAVNSLPPFQTEGDWKNTMGNQVRATNFADKMGRAGAKVIRASREDAVAAIMQCLA